MKYFLIFLLLPCTAISQVNVALLDSFMNAQVSVKRFNGNVLVAKSGEIIYQKAFGFRNYDSKEKLDNNSVFELASVSKQFTAMGILLLKEQKKLLLTDSLRKFFPELPYSNITIRHLLTHTSGLPDYVDIMVQKWDHKKIAFNDDVIKVLAKEQPKIEFKPGERWAYSNTGYAMLASIIEKVSGKSFQSYLHENIFKPLGMTQTRVYNTRRSKKEVIPNYAYGYMYNDSSKKYILPDSIPFYDFVVYLDGLQGDGIINSTTTDILKWDRALKNNTLLPEATQKEMVSPQAPTDSTSKISYGYGVFVNKNKNGDNIQFHSGGWPGYTTFLTRNVDKDVTIVVLSNNNSNSPSVANAISAIVFNEPVIIPYIHKQVPVNDTILNNYVGKYAGAAQFEIIKLNGKLYRKGKVNIELKPESPTKLFYGDETDRQIEFQVDNNGNVEKTWLINNGIKTEVSKISSK